MPAERVSAATQESAESPLIAGLKRVTGSMGEGGRAKADVERTRDGRDAIHGAVPSCFARWCEETPLLHPEPAHSRCRYGERSFERKHVVIFKRTQVLLVVVVQLHRNYLYHTRAKLS